MKGLSLLNLEIETEKFVEKVKSAGGPAIYQLTPREARGVLEQVQSEPVEKPSVTMEDKMIPGPKGQISIKIIRPAQLSQSLLPVLMFFHGAGWVMGSMKTHERLVCELAVKAKSAVVFVNYSLSPEARFPVAIEEAYAATKYISEQGKEFNLDSSHLAVVGDSVGGNMAAVVAMLAKERKGPKINCQVLFYPVTSSDLNSNSYQEFSEGPWLTKPAMEWFWNAYEPDQSARKNHLLSPLNATTDQLKGLPVALVITAEYDVLRDEGEAYAHKLMQAGVRVTAARFLGTMHDFVMLNQLAKTPATQGAIELATDFLNKYLGKGKL